MDTNHGTVPTPTPTPTPTVPTPTPTPAPPQIINPVELVILGHLREAYTAWLTLPDKGPGDDDDFAAAVRQVQMLMSYRAMVRAEPGVFGQRKG